MLQYKVDGLISDQFSCFVGEKLDNLVSESDSEIEDDEERQIVYREDARRKLKMSEVMYEDMQSLVDYVNSNGYTWTA